MDASAYRIRNVRDIKTDQRSYSSRCTPSSRLCGPKIRIYSLCSSSHICGVGSRRQRRTKGRQTGASMRQIDTRIDKATPALLALFTLHPFFVKHDHCRLACGAIANSGNSRSVCSYTSSSCLSVPDAHYQPHTIKRAKIGRLIDNLVSLNWRGGIFLSRFQYVYMDGPKRRKEDIVGLGRTCTCSMAFTVNL
jgi:hypothetical protein